MAALGSRTSTPPAIPLRYFSGLTSAPPSMAWLRDAKPLVTTITTTIVYEISIENVAQPALSPEERWLSYIRSLSGRNLATVTVTNAAERLWRKLRIAVPTIALPNASPTDEFGVSMSWNLDRHYLELDVSPFGDYDWYYRDRDNRTSSGESAQPVDAAPTEQLKTHLQTIFV